MIVKKLEVKGKGKEAASLFFEPGLNVIAGASDTGKSYVTKCFQFILGAELPPKSIEQAKGYTQLEVTFEQENGSMFLLSRELKEKSDLICIELNGDGLSKTLKPSHTGQSNLSSFFLKKFNLDNKVLVKGTAAMNHAALTLRILEKVFLVDEGRIISESSPIGKGQHTEKTLELSLLKTLLTGIDDSEVKEAKKKKESKEKIKQRINSLKEFVEQFFSQSDEINDSTELKKRLELLEMAYKEAELELNCLIESNNTLVEERDALIRKLTALNNRVSDDSTLIERFLSLREKYISDKERLEANSEATKYLGQYELMSCPLCGSETTQVPLDIETICLANAAEIKKIEIHLKDLDSTITNLTKSLTQNHEDITDIKASISEKDLLLSQKLANKVRDNKQILSDLNQVRIPFRQKLENEEKRKEIFQEIGKLQVQYDVIEDEYEILDFSNELNSLEKIISQILKRWDFPNGENTSFDIDTRDLVIGTKPRSHFGKGYRAICFSALIIGLMEFLVERKRHPGFVILDSPLTTYRKQDAGISEIEDDEVSLANNMIYAFYRDLCDFYSDKQVIVLDNQEPDEDLIQRMNYTHFSGNEEIGRYGFFPHI